MELIPHVVVTIDELDLGDVPAPRRHVVAAAFERELTRLVTDRAPDLHRTGPAAPDGERTATVVGARPDGNPVLFGTALARSVYAALEGDRP